MSVVSLRRVQSDQELLVAARYDAEAFGEFYDRHIAKVLGFFRRRVAEPEVAMDLAAETFAAALGSLPSFVPGDEPATAWLFAIARRRWFDALRRGQVEDRARRALEMEPLVVDDHALGVIDRLAAAGAMDLLDALPAEQRTAVVARHLDEREYDEIAAQLRCSESVVRKRVSRGLRSLKNAAPGWASGE
jgi:RNA polymerase sigma-70 factor (ECF subfamily)